MTVVANASSVDQTALCQWTDQRTRVQDCSTTSMTAEPRTSRSFRLLAAVTFCALHPRSAARVGVNHGDDEYAASRPLELDAARMARIRIKRLDADGMDSRSAARRALPVPQTAAASVLAVSAAVIRSFLTSSPLQPSGPR
jgi:hypothetical protein